MSVISFTLWLYATARFRLSAGKKPQPTDRLWLIEIARRILGLAEVDAPTLKPDYIIWSETRLEAWVKQTHR